MYVVMGNTRVNFYPPPHLHKKAASWAGWYWEVDASLGDQSIPIIQAATKALFIFVQKKRKACFPDSKARMREMIGLQFFYFIFIFLISNPQIIIIIIFTWSRWDEIKGFMKK